LGQGKAILVHSINKGYPTTSIDRLILVGAFHVLTRLQYWQGRRTQLKPSNSGDRETLLVGKPEKMTAQHRPGH
jgi:hypothetical protein